MELQPGLAELHLAASCLPTGGWNLVPGSCSISKLLGNTTSPFSGRGSWGAVSRAAHGRASSVGGEELDSHRVWLAWSPVRALWLPISQRKPLSEPSAGAVS